MVGAGAEMPVALGQGDSVWRGEVGELRMYFESRADRHCSWVRRVRGKGHRSRG